MVTVTDEQTTLIPRESSSIACEENSEEKEPSLWTATNLRQKCLLAFVIVGNFLLFFCTSAPSPFLARVISDRGGELVNSAMVLQSTFLAMTFAGLIFGKYQIYFGCKRLFVGGLVVVAISQLTFGLLQYVDNIYAFVFIGILIRSIQGIGISAFTVSSLTLICLEYPKYIGAVFGMAEAAFGAGYLMGPVVGGYLFQIDGMMLPTAVTGSLVFIATPISLPMLREYNFDDLGPPKYTLSDTFWNIRALLILGAAGSVYAGFGLCDSIMTEYVRSIGFSVASAGLVLFSLGISYSLAAVAAGFIVGWAVWVKKTMLICGFIGCMLMSFIFTNNQAPVWVFIGTTILGIFSAFAFVPAFDELTQALVNGGDATDFSLYSVVSGAWYFSLGVANFTLSTVGSALNTALGSFSISLVLTFAIGYLSTLLLGLIVHVIKRYIYSKPMK